MRIDPNGEIAGQPAIRVRDLFRYVSHLDCWSEETVAARLEVSVKVARGVVAELAKIGYIERKEFDRMRCWSTTLMGNGLGLATAAKPINRDTAQRIIKEFLERCRKINDDPYYLYKVTKVVVFGSFLSDVMHVNDVDLGIELEPKERESDKHMALCGERSRIARTSGRSFSNIVEDLFWPQREVILFLKARSRAISLHHEDPILAQVKTRVLFRG